MADKEEKAGAIMADKKNSAEEEPHRGFYTEKQVRVLYPVSKSTLWREINAKRFPPATRLTRGRVGWAKSVIHEHLKKL